MKNILFILGTYEEKARANGICVKNIVDELKKENNIFIISEMRGNKTKKNRVEKNLTIYKYWKNLSVYVNEKFGFKRLSKIILRFLQIIYFFFWPITNPFLPKKYFNKFKQINKKNKIDIVISEYSPIEPCIAGCNIKRKFPNVKYYVYTLDALSGGSVQRMEKFRNHCVKCMDKWEEKFFKTADKIFAMDSHKKYYQDNKNKYNYCEKKIEYVDIPFLKCIKNNNYNKNNFSRKIIYTGTLTYNYTNIDYLIKLIENLKECIFEFYGAIDKKIIKLINSNENAKYCGYLEQDELYSVQQTADFLLNFGSNVSCMISGKIFDYFSTGRPIIHLYNNDVDPALGYLEKYENKLIINENNDFQKNLEKIKKYTLNPLDTYDSYRLNDIFIKNTPLYTAKLFVENRK